MEKSGLEGVVVARTVMSHVDGERGELWIRGAQLEDLAANGRLEDAVARLWAGFVAEPWALGPARAATWRQVITPAVLQTADATGALRIALAPLDGASPVELVAAAGNVLAGWSRVRTGADPSRPIRRAITPTIWCG